MIVKVTRQIRIPEADAGKVICILNFSGVEKIALKITEEEAAALDRAMRGRGTPKQKYDAAERKHRNKKIKLAKRDKPTAKARK